MGRYLIVANQTLGGERLDQTVRDRIAHSESHFFIVVPMTAPRHESTAWLNGFAVSEGSLLLNESREVIEADARRRQEAIDESFRRAEQRLGRMVAKIRDAGGRAEGRASDADPAVAVKEVLAEQSFDEVIVSTLPVGLSRWVRMDLPSRIARMTDTPVTTIEAEE